MTNGSPMPTLELVRRSQSGDRDAREELCARYLPRVRRIVATRLGKRLSELVDIDDVVQEAILLALSQLSQFQERPDRSFYNWISTIVTNTIRNQARWFAAAKRSPVRALEHPSPPLSVSLLPGRAPSPSEWAAYGEFEQRLEDSLLSMSVAERSIIEMRALSEMGYTEIAETLGVTESTARANYARALARLLKLAGDAGGDEQ